MPTPDKVCMVVALEKWLMVLAISTSIFVGLGWEAAAVECSSRQRILCGQRLPGSLAVRGEIDCYIFEAEPNEAVRIAVRGRDWRFFGPGDIEIEDRERPLPASGTYTIRIDGDPGSYTITLEAVSETFNGVPTGLPEVTCSGLLPNGMRMYDGTRPITCGETVTESIGPPGDTDSYTFNAHAGEAVRITTAGDVCWRLFTPSGEHMFRNIYGGDECFTDGDLPFGEQAAQLPEDGTYTIVVHSDSPQGASYHLWLESISATFDGSSNGPPNPTCSGTQPIRCGDPPRPGTFEFAGETDTYTFEVTQFGRVRIQVVRDGNRAACWRLYSPQGIEVAAECLGGPLEVAVAPGVHTIHVVDRVEGSYVLSLGSCLDSCAGAASSGAGMSQRQAVRPGVQARMPRHGERSPLRRRSP